jgi:hypothetical protein
VPQTVSFGTVTPDLWHRSPYFFAATRVYLGRPWSKWCTLQWLPFAAAERLRGTESRSIGFVAEFWQA